MQRDCGVKAIYFVKDLILQIIFDYLWLISFIVHNCNFLVVHLNICCHTMKYGDLPMFIPVLAAIYLMAVYALLKVAENQSKLKSVSSNTKDNQQVEARS